MLCELGKSHTFEQNGDDGDREPAEMVPGRLGADFCWDARAQGWRLAHIVKGDTWDALRGGPLAKPGCDVMVGDILMAINGVRLDRPAMPPERALIGCAGQEVELAWLPRPTHGDAVSDGVGGSEGVSAALASLFLHDNMPSSPTKSASAPPKRPAGAFGEDHRGVRKSGNTNKKKGKSGSQSGGQRGSAEQLSPLQRPWRRIRVKVLRDELYARYVDTIAARRALVHQRSGGRCGYLHVPDCERLGFAEFHRHYVLESRRGALLIDVRKPPPRPRSSSGPIRHKYCTYAVWHKTKSAGNTCARARARVCVCVYVGVGVCVWCRFVAT